MTVHAYVNNGMPQIRLRFDNGYTASIVVTGDGGAALAHWKTFDDEESSEPVKMTESQIALRRKAVILGPQQATSQDVATWLAGVATLPSIIKETDDEHHPTDESGGS